MSSETSPQKPRILAGLLRFLLFLGMAFGLLFWPAGRWDLPFLWAYIGVFFAGAVAGIVTMQRTDPTLMQERVKPGPGGKDPKLRLYGILMFATHWALAGLDVGRRHWSDSVPLAVQIAGLAGLASAFGLSCWAISANRFYSSDVRIQRDRGHHLITGGPYRFLRHPGYASAMLMVLCSPLALGSYLSAFPALAFVPLLFRRLFREEKLLTAELEGYAEYAARTRNRLLPGVW